MNLKTRIRSKMIGIMSSDRRRELWHLSSRLKCRVIGAEPTVHYFHQVDDPYSHLAVQKLDALKAAYSLRFVSHLVNPPLQAYQGDTDRYASWARTDANSVAAFYGVSLPDQGFPLDPDEVEDASGRQAKTITLEYFPSLRSPYTAISHGRTMDLVKRSGVTLKLRPVMPMMMRGVPAPAAKQFYIVTDAKREADVQGVNFGKVVDPFGEPVKQAFSLFPWAERQGRAAEYLGAYLAAAFAEGVDITTDKGLAQVISGSGLSWSEAREHLSSNEWQKVLEDNLQEMQVAGLWGVPSFRISGGSSDAAFACWGQDRLWRVETEISRRAKSLSG